MVILTGGIDLSVGSITTFIHVFYRYHLGNAQLVLPVSLFCLLLGLVWFSEWLRHNLSTYSPFVMTLCMVFFTGANLIYTKGQPRGLCPTTSTLSAVVNFKHCPSCFSNLNWHCFLFILVLYRTTRGHVVAVAANSRELLSSLGKE